MRLREIDTAAGTAADAAAGTAADTIDAVAQDTDRPTQHKLERKLQQTRTDSNKLERACSPADRRRRHAQVPPRCLESERVKVPALPHAYRVHVGIHMDTHRYT